jgi:hypothetical protein
VTRRPLSIVATGGLELAPEADFAPVSLKPLMQEALGGPVRRVGRFIQLAMIGAARCVDGRTLPGDASILLCSGSGDMDVTVEVLEQIFRERSTPKPLSFVNTVSNAACFYLGRQFGLSGPAAFVARRSFAFQTALSQALTQAAVQGARDILLGGVDVLSRPEPMHRLRIGAPAEGPLAESSHWLLLSAAPDAPAIGRLREARMFAGLDEACGWIEGLGPAAQRLMLAEDAFDDVERRRLARAAGADLYTPARAPLGYSETRTGFVLREFLERSGLPGAQLVHADRDAQGVVAVTVVERAGIGGVEP